MNKESFVSAELAWKLHEFGFNEPCLRMANKNNHTIWKWYEVDEDDTAVTALDVAKTYHSPSFVGVPMYSQVVDWLYKTFNVWICVNRYFNSDSFFYEIKSEFIYCDGDNLPSVQQAYEEGIKYVLTNLKNK